jgi:hypothetical protein
MSGSTKGGFHIGTVVGNASFWAGGDMVAGDKITQTTTTTVNSGFKRDDAKQQFLQLIEELRTILRDLQATTAQEPRLSQGTKDEITAAALQQVEALEIAKNQAADLSVNQHPPPETLQLIEQGLASTVTVLDKVTAVCDKTVGLGEKIEPYVTKALPLLLSARHLFGLP